MTLTRSVAGRIEQTALLADARHAFELATRATGGVVEWRFAISGCSVALHFAGTGLVAVVTEALTHLRDTETGPADLDVFLWDSASTGVPFPVSDRMDLPAWRRLAPWSDVHHGNERIMHQPYEDSLAVLADSQAVYWAASGADAPFYERSAPLLHLLHWWLADRGLLVVHGGAVGRPEGGVLLAGTGGSGKTTTALSCLGSSLGYAGDDYVVVGVQPPHAFSLYRSAKVDRVHSRRLARLLPEVANPDPRPNDKALYFIDQGLALDFPIRAILLPQLVDGTRSRAARTSPATALARLAPSSILQLPGVGSGALKGMRILCEAVPAYSLQLGTDIEAIPAVIDELLRR